MTLNLNGRVFRGVSNSATGEVSTATMFRYRQDGSLVWATYSGGSIRHGQLVALVATDGSLDMRYQHVNRAGELRTGICRSLVEVLPDGRLRLRERWQWTSGDHSSGESIVEEVASA